MKRIGARSNICWIDQISTLESNFGPYYQSLVIQLVDYDSKIKIKIT